MPKTGPLFTKIKFLYTRVNHLDGVLVLINRDVESKVVA